MKIKIERMIMTANMVEEEGEKDMGEMMEIKKRIISYIIL